MTSPTSESNGPWPTYYLGRKWNAPVTDDAVLMDKEMVAKLLPHPCNFCTEDMTVDDDLMWTPGIQAHLECEMRAILGDVQHLEGRCTCNPPFGRGPGNEITLDSDHYDTYREGAKAALQWLIDHGRGRFHD